MPWLQSNITRLILLPSAATFSLVGCFQGVSDKQWEATVPGMYEGTKGNFREVMYLNTNGRFRHEVFINQELVHSGTGNWSYDVKSGMVQVEPFTSFYDRRTGRIETNGNTVMSDMFGVLRYGKAASRITQSLDTDYSLVKKIAETNSTTGGNGSEMTNGGPHIR